MSKPTLANISGFTLIEVLLTLAIIMILFGATITVFPSFQVNTDLDISASELIQTMRDARNKSINGEMNDTYGVYLEADKYTLFRGSSYNVSDPNNIVYNIPSTLVINNFNLTGTGTNVIFQKATGRALQTGTVDIGINGGKTREIKIDSSGNVEWKWKP